MITRGEGVFLSTSTSHPRRRCPVSLTSNDQSCHGNTWGGCVSRTGTSHPRRRGPVSLTLNDQSCHDNMWGGCVSKDQHASSKKTRPSVSKRLNLLPEHTRCEKQQSTITRWWTWMRGWYWQCFITHASCIRHKSWPTICLRLISFLLALFYRTLDSVRFASCLSDWLIKDYILTCYW